MKEKEGERSFKRGTPLLKKRVWGVPWGSKKDRVAQEGRSRETQKKGERERDLQVEERNRP
jgi:hypothetical protein